MTMGVWVILAALVGAVVLSGRSRTVHVAGCALALILLCFVALVLLHVVAV
jgi:hypothetical protein